MNHENTYISLASHAIGMDYKMPYTRHGKKFYKPFRNYFDTAPWCDTFKAWEAMEMAGYAKSDSNEQDEYTFWLTRAGLNWLGERLGIHIYDEE